MWRRGVILVGLSMSLALVVGLAQPGASNAGGEVRADSPTTTAPFQLGVRLADADAVVVGQVVARSGDVVTFRIDEVLRGTGSPAEIKFIVRPSNPGDTLPDGPTGLIFESVASRGTLVIETAEFVDIDELRQAMDPGPIRWLVNGDQLTAYSDDFFPLRRMDYGSFAAVDVCPGNTHFVVGSTASPRGIGVVDLQSLSEVAFFPVSGLTAPLGHLSVIITDIECRANDGSEVLAVTGPGRDAWQGGAEYQLITVRDGVIASRSIGPAYASIGEGGFAINVGCPQITLVDPATLRDLETLDTGDQSCAFAGAWHVSPEGSRAARTTDEEFAYAYLDEDRPPVVTPWSDKVYGPPDLIWAGDDLYLALPSLTSEYQLAQVGDAGTVVATQLLFNAYNNVETANTLEVHDGRLLAGAWVTGTRAWRSRDRSADSLLPVVGTTLPHRPRGVLVGYFEPAVQTLPGAVDMEEGGVDLALFAADRFPAGEQVRSWMRAYEIPIAFATFAVVGALVVIGVVLMRWMRNRNTGLG